MIDEIIFAVDSRKLGEMEEVFLRATRRACARAWWWISFRT